MIVFIEISFFVVGDAHFFFVDTLLVICVNNTCLRIRGCVFCCVLGVYLQAVSHVSMVLPAACVAGSCAFLVCYFWLVGLCLAASTVQCVTRSLK